MSNTIKNIVIAIWRLYMVICLIILSIISVWAAIWSIQIYGYIAGLFCIFCILVSLLCVVKIINIVISMIGGNSEKGKYNY